MDKMRIALTKTDETKYVGHLDFGRAIERALRRAKLPVAYSVGFNPHMKLSFGPALSVGVASDAEYVDVELTEAMDANEFGRVLSAQLPPGLSFVGARAAFTSTALAAALNLAAYRVTVAVEPTSANLDAARSALAAFQAAETVEYVRRTPKGAKTMDVKKFLVGDVSVAAGPDSIMLNFWLRMTAGGAVKPMEVLSALTSQFGFPAGDAAFCRTALKAEQSSGVQEPFEI
jgi:radical SAM-linked protein